MRLLLATAALILSVASLCAPAQVNRLPDIGSSAGTLLGPAEQEEYGRMMLSQLRNYDYILEDPLVDSWLRSLGNRLAAASDDPEQPFTFFMMKDRQVNAFATLGGYVGVNAGLVLLAESEDEVAAVLGHEIAHVTQSHVLRSVERAQKDSIPILLAMLGAIAIAQSGSGNSSDDAAMAAMASAQGIAAQRQINYTRSNESESDRLGIQTLVRSGYAPDAMASMFLRMQALERSNRGGPKERVPDYLRTHPVTITRIAEAKQRAEQMRNDGSVLAVTSTPEGTRSERIVVGDTPVTAVPGRTATNPLLPWSLQLPAIGSGRDDTQFGWARERLRVLSANTPQVAINEYERMRRQGELDDAQRYGLAYAHLLAGHANMAIDELAPLLEDHPGDIWLSLAMARAEARAGRPAAADERFESLLARMPHNRAVALTYADVLAERNNREAGKRAQEVMRPLLANAADDPLFQATFARVNEIAGDPIRAGEAWAEAAFLNGRAERALVQLNTLKKRDDLDYYARARIDARISAITPVVLELRRQGIRDRELEGMGRPR